MEEAVKKWLEDNPDYKLINIRKYAWNKADEWIEEKESEYNPNTMWNQVKREDGSITFELNEPWTDKWSDKADEIEEELLHYEYEEPKTKE